MPRITQGLHLCFHLRILYIRLSGQIIFFEFDTILLTESFIQSINSIV